MKSGLEPRMIYDLITAGAGNSRVFELRGLMMAKSKYTDVTMKIDVWDKDMQVIGDHARKIKAPTPMFNASKPVYLKAMKSGFGAQDTAAVCAVLEKHGRGEARQADKRSAEGSLLRPAAADTAGPLIAGLRRHNSASGGRDGVDAEAVGNPRRHADRLGRPDHHGRRPGAPRRRVPPGRRRPIPGASITYGPYAKNLAFQDGYPSAWNIMAEKHPDVTAGSSNKYQNWEVVDPEKWVPHDYACVRVDSRGCGCSPGVIDHFSPRETKDFYDCIEWAGVQPWSSGKVGPQRHFLSRDESNGTSRSAAAAASCRHVHLGRLGRLANIAT